jgi:signal transduction histidine kinase
MDKSDLQRQVTELLEQRAAISAVLRAIASSPHELQPIFDTVLEYAGLLCRAELGSLILFEQNGYRMVARKGPPDPYFVEGETHVYPVVPDGLTARLIKDRAPIQIADLATDPSYVRRYPGITALVEAVGARTCLLVPMLTEDELVGAIIIVRARVQPFTDTQIDLTTDFAAQAAIALESTRRERRYRETQMALAHVNRVATTGQLTASITHEVNQPIAAARNNVSAALHFLDRNPPDLQEVREALACAAKDTDRAGVVVDRMRALMQSASTRTDRVNINEAVREVIELTRGEALKDGVSVKTKLAEGLPIITGDRVQLQQVVLNLILNALQAMADVDEGARQALITTSQTELNDLYIGVQDTGPGLSPETLSRLFEPFYTTKPNGMGMGLAICRSIVEAHGGRLSASANVPRGAIFQFTLPAGPCNAP